MNELRTDPEGRPSLTLTAAAEACGVSRRTIRRRLDAGHFPNAWQESGGVRRVPVVDLIAAGLHPNASRPVTEPSTEPTSSTPPSEPSELSRLRSELEDWKRRAEIAEAVAAERADALADARLALRALTAPAPEPTSSTPPAEPPSTTTTPHRSWARLIRRT